MEYVLPYIAFFQETWGLAVYFCFSAAQKPLRNKCYFAREVALALLRSSHGRS